MKTDTAGARSAQLERLLAEEIALKDHAERVAELRRQLPIGPEVRDYVFREGPRDLARNSPSDFRDVRLSELFAPDKKNLIVYNLMFRPDDELPCPMCSMWTDGYNAVAPHVAARANFVLVAKADIGKFRAFARKRGWEKIRLLSSHDNTFNRDLGAEDEDGDQIPVISIFSLGDDGQMHHTYSKFASLDEENNRGIDFLSPVWNLFDLLPIGRGDFEPRHPLP